MLDIQFFQLHQRYGGSAREAVEVTVAELTGLWQCSERNVKIILKKLEACGWIEWMPGRGRGHVSRLHFLQDAGELLLELSKQSVHKGQMKEALERLDRYGQGTETKTQFMEWLSDYFGYTKETTGHKRMETLRFPAFRPILTLDPAKIFYALEAHLVKQIFNTLVTFHAERERIESQLAHHWECSEDGLAWTFYLRRGIYFHHGKEMTSHDAAYTFRRLMRKESPLPHSWLFKEIADVRVPDDFVLQFRLNAPNHLFLRYLCFPAASIVPADVADGREDAFGRHPVGTGPFQVHELNEWRCVLDTHLSYFEGRAHLDRIEIIIIPPEESGNVKVGPWEQVLCMHDGVSREKGHGRDWQEIHLINNGCTMMTYNMKKDGPQKDIRFRKALHHLANRRQMIDTLGENRLFPASGLRPHQYLVQDDHAYDPGTARKLLEEMGYDAGEPFRIATTWKHLEDALWIKEQCRMYGIPVEVTAYSHEEITRETHVREADAVLYQFINDEGEVSLLELFLREDSFIRLHMDEEVTARVDKIAADLLASPSPEYRTHRLHELEIVMNHEHVILFLLFKELQTFYNRSVRGVSVNSLGWIDFKHIWLQPVK